MRWKYASDEEAYAAKKAQEARYYEKQKAMRAAARAAMMMRGPSPDALQERDRAMTAPRTLSQLLCGDPVKGRSALDKMET